MSLAVNQCYVCQWKEIGGLDVVDTDEDCVEINTETTNKSPLEKDCKKCGVRIFLYYTGQYTGGIILTRHPKILHCKNP